MKNKRLILTLLLVLGLVSITVGVTYAFFNYTRTGIANNLGTGRIYFNTSQNGRLQLTNIFPVKSTDINTNTLDTVTVGIVGDTTYTDGEEFLISLVDVNNTVNNKKIPIKYIATYEANSESVIGTSSSEYWTARNNKDANIYLLNGTGAVEENKQVLVGYIDNGDTGINGTLTIKAYIDGDRIAISDTYDETESDNMGTTTEWVDGRTVFTTTEWNSFQTSGTPISFKIKAESNEGIWVTEPVLSTIGYVVSSTSMSIGQAIPTGVNVRTNPTDAMADWSAITGVANDTRPYYLKYVLNQNNEIEESYVEFVVTEDMATANPGMIVGTYTLKGGDSGAAFEENINVIKTAFDYENYPDRCRYQTDPDRFSCGSSEPLTAFLRNDGTAFVTSGSLSLKPTYDTLINGCNIDNDGSSNCE